MKRISDTIKYPKKPYQKDVALFQKAFASLSTSFVSLYSWTLGILASSVTSVRRFLGLIKKDSLDQKKKIDIYENAKRRYNHAITIRLKHKETNQLFWVANYHMPCAFYSPPICL